jgi:hypothetical protein
MPSSFDCHDQAGGFDCKIRIDTHDVYGPSPSGWVIDYDGGGTNNLLSELQASGSIVVGISYSGFIMYRQSSGAWDELLKITSTAGTYCPEMCVHSGEVFWSRTRPTGGVGELVTVTSGVIVSQLLSNQLVGFSVIKDESNLYWLNQRATLSGTGALLTGSWEWSGLKVRSVTHFLSNQTLSGHWFWLSGRASGATGNVRSTVVLASGASGFPKSCREPCVCDGIAYADSPVSGLATGRIWSMPSYAAGWNPITSSGGTGVIGALGSNLYVVSTPATTLYIMKYDPGAGVLSVDLAFDVTGRNSDYPYFTTNGTSLWLSAHGYVFRKDL